LYLLARLLFVSVFFCCGSDVDWSNSGQTHHAGSASIKDNAPSVKAAPSTNHAGDTFAIKVLTKTELVRKNMVESVTNERNILAMVRV
jgi:hypothetical protein